MSQLYMLEGAKSIGAGAATIALAGAAVGIGNGTQNQLIRFANECYGVAYSFFFLFLISFFFLSHDD